jgi:hypothetical protein
LSVVRKSNKTGAWPGLELDTDPFPMTRDVVETGIAAVPDVSPKPVAALDVGRIGVVRYTLDRGGRDAGTEEETKTRPFGPMVDIDPFVEVVEFGMIGRVVDPGIGFASDTGAAPCGVVESLLLLRGLDTPGLLPRLFRGLPFDIPVVRLMGFAMDGDWMGEQEVSLSAQCVVCRRAPPPLTVPERRGTGEVPFWFGGVPLMIMLLVLLTIDESVCTALAGGTVVVDVDVWLEFIPRDGY